MALRRGIAALLALAAMVLYGAQTGVRVPRAVLAAPGRPIVPGEAISVTPAAPVQGDTLAFVVHAPAGSAVAVRFNGTAMPVFAVGQGIWRALAGTDPETPSGSYTAVATITRSGASAVTIARTIHVAATHFGERHLTLAPKIMGLVTPHNEVIEAQALNFALARRTPTALWHGPFHLPVAGPIDSPYGLQGFYNGHREWWHQGTDFDVPAGTPVAAPNDGVVVLARALPLGGNTVILDHGQGVLTEYIHLSVFSVHPGERVAQDQIIGRVGATGLVTGPSLHWGFFAAGHWVNALFWTVPRPGLTE